MAFGFGLGFPRAAVNSGGAFAGAALALDMTSGNQTLDPRVTFTRTSNATVTKSDGTIGYAPHNLLTYSEQFDNAAWAKTNATVSANVVTAPDGKLTADKLVESSSLSDHAINQGSVTVGVTYAISFYAKAAERSKLQISGLGLTSQGYAPIFDIDTASVSGAPAGSSATPVGNGWVRCFIPVTASGNAGLFIYLVSGSSNNYQGDGTSGIYIWGAQLNVGALQPYYPTTVKNLLGYTQEFDNAVWAKSNSFVQTNLCLYSRELDSVLYTQWQFSIGAGAWAPTETTAAPDGTVSGRTYTAVAGGNANTGYQVMAVTAATVYTWSLHVKLGTLPQNELKIAFRDDTAGVFIAQDIAPTLISVGNGWGRLTYTLTTPVGCGLLRCYVIRNTGPTVGGTVSFWGAQLVQGSSPGDYVTTYGTTRAVMYAAPDGTMTADKLVEDTANNFHLTAQYATGFVSGSVIKASVFVKAAERYSFRLQTDGPPGPGSADFNLQTGAVVSSSGIVSSASIQSVGGGWYRCSATYAATASGALGCKLILSTGSVFGVAYTGDGTSGIYIWGAQLSDSASLDPYVYNPGAAPAASAYYGPRFDYDPVTLQPKGLLIEEQRTNLFLQSEDLGTTWNLGTGSTLTTNVWTTPASTLTGDTFTIAADATTPSQSVTVANSTAYTFSFYFNKTLTTASFLRLRFGTAAGSVSAFINVSTAAFGTLGAGASNGVIQPVGSDVYRASVTMTYGAADAGSRSVAVAGVMADNSTTADTGKNIAIWGMQFEAGAFPTSYIPTTTAAATRAADIAVMTGANFSSWYRQDEGTLFADCDTAPSGGTAQRRIVYVGVSTDRLDLRIATDGISTGFNVVSGGVTQAAITGVGTTAYTKIVGAYKVNDFSAATNGVLGTPDTSGAVPNISQISFGSNGSSESINGHIRRIAYYPRRLSNAELQGITA